MLDMIDMVRVIENAWPREWQTPQMNQTLAVNKD